MRGNSTLLNHRKERFSQNEMALCDAMPSVSKAMYESSYDFWYKEIPLSLERLLPGKPAANTSRSELRSEPIERHEQKNKLYSKTEKLPYRLLTVTSKIRQS